jgi:hypothetical protein
MWVRGNNRKFICRRFALIQISVNGYLQNWRTKTRLSTHRIMQKRIQEGKLPQTVYKWNLIQTWKRGILLNSPLRKCFFVERIHKHWREKMYGFLWRQIILILKRNAWSMHKSAQIRIVLFLWQIYLPQYNRSEFQIHSCFTCLFLKFLFLFQC